MSELHTYGVSCPHCGAAEKPQPKAGRDIRFECGSWMRVDYGVPVPTAVAQLDRCFIRTLEKQLVAEKTDAARYRFIRDKLASNTGSHWCVFMAFEEHPTFDAAIDAMMQQQAAGGGE